MSFFPQDLPASWPNRDRIEWEEAACPLCGRQRWTQVLEGPDFTVGGSGMWFAVVQCQDCGICYTNPRPSVRSMARFYLPEYPAHQRKITAGTRRQPLLRLLSSRMTSRVTTTGVGRLLDFGCGAGRFLEQAQREGWQAIGLELSADARQVASRAGLQVLAGTLPHPQLRAGTFDVVTMRHSLEHVHEPLETLKQAYRLLGPGGQLLVSVPNMAGLPYRWFGRAWIGLDLPRHLTHFTPRTLQRMLARAGFEVQRIDMVRHANWLRLSARRALAMGRRSPWHRVLMTRFGGSLASWYSYLTHRTDCLLVIARRPAEVPRPELTSRALHDDPEGRRPTE